LEGVPELIRRDLADRREEAVLGFLLPRLGGGKRPGSLLGQLNDVPAPVRPGDPVDSVPETLDAMTQHLDRRRAQPTSFGTTNAAATTRTANEEQDEGSPRRILRLTIAERP